MEELWKLFYYEASVSKNAACLGIIRSCIGVYEHYGVFMAYYCLIV